MIRRNNQEKKQTISPTPMLMYKIQFMKNILIMLGLTIFGAAYSQQMPSVVPAVDLKKYSGTWYEIARLPFYFERKLTCCTATYTIRDDGKVTVVNAGYYISDRTKKTSSTGVAWVPDKNSPAKLKVQFFWPFNGDYWIIFLEKDYKYVLVGNPSFDNLWILSREKKMDETAYNMLLKIATENGFDIKPLIKVEQNCN
jgi:apolipoprotein D and lipocalin family protein